MKLKDKIAVVTGGASGIGLAIVEKFSAAGAKVIILDYNKENGEAAVNSLKERGMNAVFHSCNVADAAAVNDLFEEFADIDILVNNAGVSHIGNLQNTTEDDFDRIYKINVKGVFNCSKAAIHKMLKKGEGVILNMASVASVIGIPDRFAYSMSKGAVLTMTYSIACDFVSKNIRCNSISPARVHTPFVDDFIAKNYPGEEKEMFDKLAATQPIGRMGKPEEVAQMALYLCCDDSSFITGTNFQVDGGFINLKI